ncbi:hypothetical protein FRB90_005471 [Tulasnella sp. 427]|nr:hypothetical protein FRB90_005497 [Tulasnella sp. 427]KAG8984226.1 hypothetical protein FRB90_005471 [Tulasnella sp. 427]
MPIAPITGKLRKRLILDISMALGLGTAGAYAYWYGYHVPSAMLTSYQFAVRRREEFYRQLNAASPANESH